MQGSWSHTKKGVPRGEVQRGTSITPEETDAVITLFVSEKDNRTSVIAEKTGIAYGRVNRIINRYLDKKTNRL